MGLQRSFPLLAVLLTCSVCWTLMLFYFNVRDGSPTLFIRRWERATIHTDALCRGASPDVHSLSPDRSATTGTTAFNTCLHVMPNTNVSKRMRGLKLQQPRLMSASNPFAFARNLNMTSSHERSSAQLTMDLTVLDRKMFLVSAYADHRGNPPKIKVIVYAAKNYAKSLFCLLNRRRYQAHLIWINFPTDEFSIWRAGYLECTISGLTSMLAATAIQVTDAEGVLRARLSLGQPPLKPAASVSRGPTFGLCVKSGYGAPSAPRFVEWMELNALLGVERVVLYDQSLHGPIVKAMQHYVDGGSLVVVKDNFRRLLEEVQPTFVSLFAGFDATQATGDEPFCQMELLSIQDCFHRFRTLYDYIIVADIDEVIVPTSGRVMHSLLRELKLRAPIATSFVLRAAVYLPTRSSPEIFNTSGGALQSVAASFAADNPAVPYMLSHRRRTVLSWEGSKAFHSTADTNVLNWHRRIHPDINVVNVEPTEAWLHHYRSSCKGQSCSTNAQFVTDNETVLGRFAEDLTSRVATVMDKLGKAIEA